MASACTSSHAMSRVVVLFVPCWVDIRHKMKTIWLFIFRPSHGWRQKLQYLCSRFLVAAHWISAFWPTPWAVPGLLPALRVSKTSKVVIPKCSSTSRLSITHMIICHPTNDLQIHYGLLWFKSRKWLHNYLYYFLATAIKQFTLELIPICIFLHKKLTLKTLSLRSYKQYYIPTLKRITGTKFYKEQSVVLHSDVVAATYWIPGATSSIHWNHLRNHL